MALSWAEGCEVSYKHAEMIVDFMVAHITKHLAMGERVRLQNSGIFQVKKRAARKGFNPATGESIHIKASKQVAFRASRELKEKI